MCYTYKKWVKIMAYLKNFSGQILLKIEDNYIKEFSGMIKYKIDGFLSKSEMMALLAIIYAS